MNNYPINSTARKFHDIEGNECSLRYLIKKEPEWAKSRILVLEFLLKELLDECIENDYDQLSEDLENRVRKNLP